MMYALQRISALAMIPFVAVHLGMIVYAVRGGLTADEILSRTHGNTAWTVFYLLFVLAVSIHAPIGVANVLKEWTPLPRHAVVPISAGLAVLLLALGLRAVAGVSGWTP